MDRQVALIVASTIIRTQSELGDLLPFVKANCDQEIYKKFLAAMGGVLAEIGLELLNPIFDLHPELKVEFDERRSKYGRLF